MQTSSSSRVHIDTGKEEEQKMQMNDGKCQSLVGLTQPLGIEESGSRGEGCKSPVICRLHLGTEKQVSRKWRWKHKQNMRIRATWSAMHWKWAMKVALGYSSTFSQTDKRDCGRKQRYKCGWYYNHSNMYIKTNV